MKLSHSDGQLAELIRDFNHVWHRTAEHWNDQRREAFYREHIEPMIAAVGEGAAALNQLSNVLKQVDRRCS